MQYSRRSIASALVALPVAAVLSDVASGQATELRPEAEAARLDAGLPALALLASRDAQVLETTAVGFRARGSSAAVTTGDRWHIGSCAKAMTATLIARLVERGRMGWDSPLASLLPDQARAMHPETARITLYDLVTMRSGLPANPASGLTVGQLKSGLRAIQAGAADDRARRLLVAERMLSSAPRTAPGSAFGYSNTGYILLGAIAEQAADELFDRLIARELFQPLAIADFGFGAPGTDGALDQPRGHEARADGQPIPPESEDADLPSFMRPAGGIHMTLAAWHRFVADHAAGERGGGVLLRPETYVRLHSRPGPTFPYAGGWGVSTDQGRRMLSHVGNNTRFTAMVQAFPDSGHAFLFTSNDGRDKASVRAFDRLRTSLKAKFLPPPAAQPPEPR